MDAESRVQPVPLQNRVTPLSELVADPARGLVYGNRGCLHDGAGRDPAAVQRQALDRVPARVPRLAPRAADAARAASRSCSSSTRRPRSPPGTARARCAAARTTTASRALWREIHPGQAGADAIDAQLHDERVDPARARSSTTRRRSTSCPTARSWCTTARRTSCSAGSCCAGRPAATAPTRRAGGVRAQLITPPSLTAILRAGWEPAVPLLHPSAQSG